MDGLFLIDKSLGMTSFDVIRRLRRLTSTRKFGHVGTLDPDATGLLPILCGKATKLIPFLPIDEKIYEFEMKLGTETDTGDASGTPVAEISCAHVDRAMIEGALGEFYGVINQVPPRYSAIRVDGQRSYQRARRGEDFEVPSREVHVYELQIVSIDSPIVAMEVRCGSGTYVRSLARDIGRAIGTCAHTISIRRTRVGPFSIETALSLEQLEGSPVETGLQPPLAAVAHLPRWMMSDGEVANIILGRSIACPDELTDSDHVALTNSQGLLVSIARVQTGADEVRLQPKRVLAS